MKKLIIVSVWIVMILLSIGLTMVMWDDISYQLYKFQEQQFYGVFDSHRLGMVILLSTLAIVFDACCLAFAWIIQKNI